MFKVLQISKGYSDGYLEKDIIEGAGGIHTLISSEDENDIIAAGQDADGLLVTLTNISEHLIMSLPKLKIIVRAGIGVDNIDLEAAKKHNIWVCNLPRYCQDEVADHTLALLLALERKIIPQVNDIKKGQWNSEHVYKPVYGLKDRTVGFIGCGGIAQKVITRLKPFGVKIIGTDPYIGEEKAAEMGVELVEFERVVSESDYISLHLPLNNETFHIVDKDFFAKMKSSAYIINTSRGPLIDTMALYEAIKSEQIAGAGLDIIENDLEGAKHFAMFSNVLITPHLAYYSENSDRNIKVQAGEIFAKFIRNEEINSIIVQGN